jgi:hypothetical protein
MGEEQGLDAVRLHPQKSKSGLQLPEAEAVVH